MHLLHFTGLLYLETTLLTDRSHSHWLFGATSNPFAGLIYDYTIACYDLMRRRGTTTRWRAIMLMDPGDDHLLGKSWIWRASRNLGSYYTLPAS
jgi:hypothetical protein